MKNIKIAIVLFSLSCLALASCEKTETVNPKMDVNNIPQSDSLKIKIENEIIPPDLPTGNGGPK